MSRSEPSESQISVRGMAECSCSLTGCPPEGNASRSAAFAGTSGETFHPAAGSAHGSVVSGERDTQAVRAMTASAARRLSRFMPLLRGRHRYGQRDVVDVAHGARDVSLAGRVVHQDDAAESKAPHLSVARGDLGHALYRDQVHAPRCPVPVLDGGALQVQEGGPRCTAEWKR